MENPLPDVQYVLRPNIVELRAGHPDLDLLPAKALDEAARTVLEREAPQALSYGFEQGPGCLIGQLRAWLERMEKSAPPSDRLMVTGGSSQALDMLCMLLTEPGDTALVQSPTYHLALRIMRDHQLELVPVPSDVEGLRVDALEDTLKALERRGRKARLLYLVSTYANPTGATLSPDRRKALVKLARHLDLLLVEDDVYHQLWYDTPPPPSLYHFDSAGNVVRLGSFSKILAPGLRLGWLSAAPRIIERFVKSGVLDSGGGVSHFAGHVVAAYMEPGHLDLQVETLRTVYRERRDVLVNALERHLPDECLVTRPGGGFFVWLRLPEGMDSSALLPRAEAGGVSYIPGERFHVNGDGGSYCRLNFTMLSLSDLEEGARRLGDVLHRALQPA